MQIAELVVWRTKAWLVGAAVGFAAFAGGCRRSSSSPPPDSAHAALLQRYVRDSTVLDSLSRLVNTDSLRALYRLALEPSVSGEKLLQEAWCEETRLMVMHGVIPARKAIDRMLDTVYADRGIRGRDDAFGVLAARAPRSSGVDGRACGRMPPRSPEIVAGIRVNQNLARPPMR